MTANERYFVEWKEQFVSKERGNRVVHYFLKDNYGESILTVVGTERSVRHMFYVVSEEFLGVHGTETSVHAGFRWRSRREVVNWLTSMLSKHNMQGDYAMSPKDDLTLEVNAPHIYISLHKGRLARKLRSHHLDITWSGAAWACGKRLKHYSAFLRNGISILVHSFVFVMAEKEKQYIAYLEDMYEDRKCQKKVKVRWFHHNKEVREVSSWNPHPKELFITPYAQVISAECVDGPVIILTREHYEKCLAVFPDDLLDRVHFCSRQFKSNRTKLFKLSKLRGYFDQPIFSCFSPDFFEEQEFSSEDDAKGDRKRHKSVGDHHKPPYDLSFKKYGPPTREPCFFKHADGHLRHTPVFASHEKVEFLCQDSGIRGCWFRCTVLEVARRQMRVLYDDVKDEDSCANLEEWIPTNRLAKGDKLGMRHVSRPTIRPAYPTNKRDLAFEVGDPADAWWSDGWWEGVISGTSDGINGTYQIYIPGENLHLNIDQKNLRVSRDWIGDRWVDIEPKPNVFSLISSTSTDAKLSASPAISKDSKSNISPTCGPKVVTSHKLYAVNEELDDLPGMTLTNVPLRGDCTNNVQQQVNETEEKENYSKPVSRDGEENFNYDLSLVNVVNGTLSGSGKSEMRNGIDNSTADNNLVECKITEMNCEVETMEMLIEC